MRKNDVNRKMKTKRESEKKKNCEHEFITLLKVKRKKMFNFIRKVIFLRNLLLLLALDDKKVTSSSDYAPHTHTRTQSGPRKREQSGKNVKDCRREKRRHRVSIELQFRITHKNT